MAAALAVAMAGAMQEDSAAVYPADALTTIGRADHAQLEPVRHEVPTAVYRYDDLPWPNAGFAWSPTESVDVAMARDANPDDRPPALSPGLSFSQENALVAALDRALADRRADWDYFGGEAWEYQADIVARGEGDAAATDAALSTLPAVAPSARASLSAGGGILAGSPDAGLMPRLGNKAPAADALAKSDASAALPRQASLEPFGPTVSPAVPPPLTAIVRIQFSTPVLAPMAHTFFCLRYPDECRVHQTLFHRGPIVLNAKRWDELLRVNAAVNRAIVPQRNTGGLAAEKWLIAPKAGECHDYAVTKRHELIALGWPARHLLLSEVVTSSGEHHLVLVIRSNEGDLVADNLRPDIRSWSEAPYQWVRIQTPDNPTFWSQLVSVTTWVKNSGTGRRET